MSALHSLRKAARALADHPAPLLPAAALGLLLVPQRFLLLAGADTVANTFRLVTFLATPYFLGLVVAGGGAALDDDLRIQDAFTHDGHFLRLLGAGVLQGVGIIVGLLVVGLFIQLAGPVGLLFLVLPLGVLVATQFYPVFAVHADAGIVGSLTRSVSVFEYHAKSVLGFSVVAFFVGTLPELVVLAVWLDLPGVLSGEGWAAIRSPMATGDAAVLALVAAGLTAVAFALRWAYAVAFCREVA